MKITIKDHKGLYVVSDVDGYERGDSVTVLRLGRDTIFVATKDIVEVDSR